MKFSRLTFIKGWAIPMAVAGLVFVVVRPALAQITEGPIASSDVKVEDEVVNGYQQVYYEDQGKKHFITSGNRNSHSPNALGEYIVYVGDVSEIGQIFLYHISDNSTIQVTNFGTNSNPRASKDGKVAWEGWVNDRWQIFFFDGIKTKQLTEGDTSVNPDIDGDFVVFSRINLAGSYRSVVYSINKNEEKEVSTGISSKRAKIKDGKVILVGTGVEEEFPLTIDDLFLLNLAPLTATSSASPSATITPVPIPETVTKEDIVEELNATPAASPAGTDTQESSSSGQLATPTPPEM